jgi:hypothetical protein
MIVVARRCPGQAFLVHRQWQSLAEDGPIREGRLFDFDTLAEARQLPEDIHLEAAPALVLHRDI